MRKELIYAILAGTVFGLVVAFGIWRINVALKKSGASSFFPKPSTSPQDHSVLTLNKPEDESVVAQSAIAISGIAKPLSWIVISQNDVDVVFQTDESGSFEKNVELDSGANKLLVWSIEENGATYAKPLTLVYSTEFAKNLPAVETLPSGTSEADIRERIQKKVQEVLKNPKAYLGVVTTIAEATIQIKTTSGEIRQVSADPKDTTVVKVGAVGNQEVKFSDIAIGDFIVAMGYRNGNVVLNAKRILITTPPGEPKNQVFLAKVSEVTKKGLSANLVKGGQTVSLTPSKDSKIKLSSFNKDDVVIVVGIKEEGIITARILLKVTGFDRTEKKS